MKVKIKGVIGTITEMQAMVEFTRDCRGKVKKYDLLGYMVKIMEAPGKTIQFDHVNTSEIEYISN